MNQENKEDSQIDLTIVVCTVPNRIAKALDLFLRLSEAAPENFEILLIGDNKKRSIGKKRETGITLAQGKYITWLDDDDDFTAYTFPEFTKGVASDADVICGKSLAILNGKPGFVDFDLDNENEEFRYNDITKRLPFPQGCAWKMEIVKNIQFPDSMYGEDWEWAKQALMYVKTQYKTDSVIHIYKHDEKGSEAVYS